MPAEFVGVGRMVYVRVLASCGGHATCLCDSPYEFHGAPLPHAALALQPSLDFADLPFVEFNIGTDRFGCQE